MAEPESVDLVDTLAQNWAKGVSSAKWFVMEAEKQAALVHATSAGPIKTLETGTWLQRMAEGRGALTVLRTLIPDDTHANELWERLNHCPMIALMGLDRPPAGPTQLRLIK